MPDIFGRAPSPFAGAFSADSSTLSLAGIDQALSLVQQLSINYTQPVNTLFEIGSNNRYYVVGRTTGQMQMGRIIGPTVVSTALLQRLGNVCSAGNRDLTMTLGNSACTGTGTGKSVTLMAKACVATMIGYSMQSQDMLINEQLQIIFGELSRTSGADGGTPGLAAAATASSLAALGQFITNR